MPNLLNNALRHTPTGGTIDLILSFDRVDRSSSRETGGSGFEFAISKALVGTRGGTISAESSGRNQGSRFRIWLPSAATHSQTNSSVGQ